LAVWKWLTARRERQARIVAAAQEQIAAHGDRARQRAIEFAWLSRDGKQVEDGKDAQFWWRVVNEIDRLQGTRRLDTATRYHEGK
jgi:hypothetical protein